MRPLSLFFLFSHSHSVGVPCAFSRLPNCRLQHNCQTDAAADAATVLVLVICGLVSGESPLVTVAVTALPSLCAFTPLVTLFTVSVHSLQEQLLSVAVKCSSPAPMPNTVLVAHFTGRCLKSLTLLSLYIVCVYITLGKQTAPM